ncbi:MAG: 50S ribosomal protein L25/general stress protein Ctc [Candidatus Thermochlorobacter aerophilum]|jgi:large subunit ribosomal protein L25|uniref:Large ribosomal subunit protein bL25 n=1 Tax=Candidatus Thermochlorobacter aerophilus TaxID=1868324 RepID=A0A395LZL9_9BACT|nr:MAG: 50S ribosomal protein L25/general stress protein Ctc [Candidatus Thermochlorobacter aerophilum]RFM23980.1 MAG: 50S ribosomal protein L25/general stress protein Ctc [Candidatus Thermochlorobacter aerophilum]
MQTIVLEAETRQTRTKGELKALRRRGFVPAVLYHKGEPSLPLAVKESALRKLVYTTESHLVCLKFSDGTEKQAIMKDRQFDPLGEHILHADFQLIKADEMIDTEVPTLFKGTPAGVVKGGRVQVLMHKLLIRTLPGDIPEHIEFDISHMEIGDTLHIKDANEMFASAKWKILGDPSVSIVSIVAPIKAATATAATAAAESETAAKGKEKTSEKTEKK